MNNLNSSAHPAQDSANYGESQTVCESLVLLDGEAILDRFCDRSINITSWCEERKFPRRTFYDVIGNRLGKGGGRKTKRIRQALANEGLLVATKTSFSDLAAAV